MKKSEVWSVSIKVLSILIGTFIMGCAYNLFYAPLDIVLGGFGGLAMLISGWLESAGVIINMNIIYFVLNIVLYIFAVKLLGKSFAFYTLIGICSYSLFLQTNTFLPTTAIPDDPLLCCLYGGVIIGLGVGIVVRVGGSTGGSDLLGCIANRYSNKMTVGNVSMAINIAVIVLSVFTYGLGLALYAVISIYISGLLTDLVVEGPKTVKAYYIISKNYCEIADKIMAELGRGVTAFFAEGMYTKNEQHVLLCIVYKHQIGRLKNIIYSIDNRAFVYSVSVNDAMGKGFSTLSPAKNILQKLTLKNNQKAVKPQTTNEQFSVLSPTCSVHSGVNVYDADFKADLNTTKDNATEEKTKTNTQKKNKTTNNKKTNKKANKQKGEKTEKQSKTASKSKTDTASKITDDTLVTATGEEISKADTKPASKKSKKSKSKTN